MTRSLPLVVFSLTLLLISFVQIGCKSRRERLSDNHDISADQKSIADSPIDFVENGVAYAPARADGPSPDEMLRLVDEGKGSLIIAWMVPNFSELKKQQNGELALFGTMYKSLFRVGDDIDEVFVGLDKLDTAAPKLGVVGGATSIFAKKLPVYGKDLGKSIDRAATAAGAIHYLAQRGQDWWSSTSPAVSTLEDTLVKTVGVEAGARLGQTIWGAFGKNLGRFLGFSEDSLKGFEFAAAVGADTLKAWRDSVFVPVPLVSTGVGMVSFMTRFRNRVSGELERIVQAEGFNERILTLYRRHLMVELRLKPHDGPLQSAQAVLDDFIEKHDVLKSGVSPAHLPKAQDDARKAYEMVRINLSMDKQFREGYLKKHQGWLSFIYLAHEAEPLPVSAPGFAPAAPPAAPPVVPTGRLPQG